MVYPSHRFCGTQYVCLWVTPTLGIEKVQRSLCRDLEALAVGLLSQGGLGCTKDLRGLTVMDTGGLKWKCCGIGAGFLWGFSLWHLLLMGHLVFHLHLWPGPLL